MHDEQQQGGGGGNAWVRRLLPLLILIIGVVITVALVKSRKPPKRKARVDHGVLVRVLTARLEKRTVQVSANGVVQPRREVSIAPEVNGRVRWTNPALVVGGLLKRGQPLLVVDGADYKIAIQRAEAQVAQVARVLAEARSSAMVARREWKVLGKRVGGKAATPLTLHVPQLKAAQAQASAARADLQQAKLNLSRTVIRAPFNLRVRQKMVDLGQYVRVGQIVATVYDTDMVEVVVSLPMSELRWLKVPGPADARRLVGSKDALMVAGPKVSVRLRTGEGAHEREGVLVRSVGEVDPSGRMSKVVVAIVDPFNLQAAAGGGYRPTFDLGAFVEVLLPGKALERVIPLPAEALRLGSVVWLAGKDDRLQIKPVTVVRRTEDEVLVAGGLKPGDRVVLTRISGAVAGLKLRVRREAGGTKNGREKKGPEQVSLRPAGTGGAPAPDVRSAREPEVKRR